MTFTFLDAELDISFIQNDSGVNGEIYAHFDQGFTAFKVAVSTSAI
jgi:hypothetical protein